MFPIVLDLKKIPVLLIGEGEALTRRKKQLEEYGETQVTVGDADKPEFTNSAIIMIAGLSYEKSKQIADVARAAGKLVNVEDMNDLCDFYFTANVKRGDLVIAVSTGGASPTLARRIRDYIAEKIGKEWENRVVEIADFRKKLKEDGKTTAQVLAASDDFLQKKGWLK